MLLTRDGGFLRPSHRLFTRFNDDHPLVRSFILAISRSDDQIGLFALLVAAQDERPISPGYPRELALYERKQIVEVSQLADLASQPRRVARHVADFPLVALSVWNARKEKIRIVRRDTLARLNDGNETARVQTRIDSYWTVLLRRNFNSLFNWERQSRGGSVLSTRVGKIPAAEQTISRVTGGTLEARARARANREQIIGFQRVSASFYQLLIQPFVPNTFAFEIIYNLRLISVLVFAALTKGSPVDK